MKFTGKELKKKRLEKNISVSKMADILDVTRPTIYTYEDWTPEMLGNMSVRLFMNWCNLLEINIAEAINGIEN